MAEEDTSVLTRASRAPDERVAYGSHPDQVADVRFGGAEAPHRPLVLIFHGGFWRPHFDRAHTGPMAEAIDAAGWTVASAEYRRVSGEPDLTLSDVGEALARLPGLVPRHNGRVVLVGHSAGGHLALWVSAVKPSRHLIGTLALAPAADLQLAHELNLGDGAVVAFLGTTPQQRTDADPRRAASPMSATTIVHGDDDAIVPLRVSESYVAAHSRARLVRLAEVGHFSVIDPLSAAWPHVLEELRRLAS